MEGTKRTEPRQALAHAGSFSPANHSPSLSHYVQPQSGEHSEIQVLKSKYKSLLYDSCNDLENECLEPDYLWDSLPALVNSNLLPANHGHHFLNSVESSPSHPSGRVDCSQVCRIPSIPFAGGKSGGSTGVSICFFSI